MTKIDAYVRAHRLWQTAIGNLEAAREAEHEADIARQEAWRQVKYELPPGAYLSESRSTVVIVGGGDYPEPQQVLSERPAGLTTTAQPNGHG